MGKMDPKLIQVFLCIFKMAPKHLLPCNQKILFLSLATINLLQKAPLINAINYTTLRLTISSLLIGKIVTSLNKLLKQRFQLEQTPLKSCAHLIHLQLPMSILSLRKQGKELRAFRMKKSNSHTAADAKRRRRVAS